MSLRQLSWAWEQYQLRPRERMTLLALAQHADRENRCFPSVRLLAQEANISGRSVELALNELERGKLIQREHQYRADGSQTSTRFHLLLPVPKNGTEASPWGEEYSPEGANILRPSHADSAPLEPGQVNPVKLNPETPPFGSPQRGGAAVLSAKEQSFQARLAEQITLDFRDEMAARYAPAWEAAAVQEIIELALSHDAARKCRDLRAYVNGWLRRDAEHVGNHPGKIKPRPPPPGSLSLAAFR